MGLSRKTFLVISTTILLLSVILFFATRFILLNEFKKLQDQKVTEKISSVRELINERLKNLEVTTKDWSSWDDTYFFLTGENDSYVEENLKEDTLENLGLNFIMLFDYENSLIFEEFYDKNLKRKITTPSELIDHMKPDSKILDNKGREYGNSGIIMLPENPVLFCSQEVLRNDGSGPASGSLVWGYYLDKNEIENMGQMLSADIILSRLDNGPDISTLGIISNIDLGSNTFIDYPDKNQVRGYFLLDDYYKKPVILFNVLMKPDIYNQGVASTYYILFSIVLAGIVIATMIIVHLDKMVLSRLRTLALETNTIGRLSGVQRKVSVKGRDEITKLATEINIMLDAKQKHESILEHYASHDILTGVFNRRGFEVELIRAVSRASRGVKSFLIFMDVDNFKIINDNCGHAFGDKVLMALCQLIKENIRREDVIARFGGDEFLILIEHEDMDQAKSAAERLRSIINDFNVSLKNDRVSFTVSMGMVEIEGNEPFDLLLKKADKAMYHAKEMGKNRLSIYEPSLEVGHGRYEILSKVKAAIENNELELYIQPIVEMEKEEIAYYEALIRLHDGKNGIILPESFIPLAEKNGLINEITYWILDKVLKKLKNDGDKCIFINLSVLSLSDNNFLEKIKSMILQSEINPEQLGFEITESSMLNDIISASEWIEAIKELGCRFAIDDFGTGFSSYSVLSELPIDFFKIDGSIVRDLDIDYNKTAMLKSIKLLADLLGKKTVAEWIENKNVAEIIKKIGIDYGQGFYYGIPNPAE